MTKDEIMAMVPGRELDVLIATKIMGRNDSFGVLTTTRMVMDDTCGRKLPDGYKERTPYYSTNISAAWQVVEKIKRKEIRGWGDVRISWGNYGPDTTPKGPCGQMIYPNEMAWLCSIESDVNNKSTFVNADAVTAPEAICKAVLLAVE